MTDNEIIKALECCSASQLCALEKCPIHATEYCHSPTLFYGEILDLINRQKAEIEQHKNTIAEIQSEISILRDANENLQGMYLREKTKV